MPVNRQDSINLNLSVPAKIRMFADGSMKNLHVALLIEKIPLRERGLQPFE